VSSPLRAVTERGGPPGLPLSVWASRGARETGPPAARGCAGSPAPVCPDSARRGARLLTMDRSRDHDSVRRSYDAVAEQYVASFGGELAGKPLDRALLGCLVEQSGKDAPVADLGCGPGHVAAWLASGGAAVVGIDLSPGMIAVGRREYPQVEFRAGDFLALPAGAGEFAAVVALYSIIHLDPGELRGAFAEMCRVLRPGGLVLVAFHAGTEVAAPGPVVGPAGRRGLPLLRACVCRRGYGRRGLACRGTAGASQLSTGDPDAPGLLPGPAPNLNPSDCTQPGRPAPRSETRRIAEYALICRIPPSADAARRSFHLD
jgi:SAM-dependent methyltransferase